MTLRTTSWVGNKEISGETCSTCGTSYSACTEKLLGKLKGPCCELCRDTDTHDTYEVVQSPLKVYTGRLADFWSNTPDDLKWNLQDALVDLVHKIQVVALAHGGYEPGYGMPRDIRKAKFRYITGSDVDTQCIGMTNRKVQCRNSSYAGEKHCYTHASESERRRAERTSFRWDVHFQTLLREVGLQDEHYLLLDAIKANSKLKDRDKERQ